MIRASSIALSAVIGGADRIVIPPSSADVESSTFHRRIARNLHHLYRMESKLESAPDPAKGAYYLEKLTNQIAAAVWKRLTSAQN